MSHADALTRALEAARGGRHREARELCLQVLSAEADNHRALYLLGVIAAQIGQFHDAQTRFREAVRANPNETSYQINLGNVCRILGDMDEAVASFEKALVREPGNLAACKGLAFSSMPGEQYEKLLKRFHEWLKPGLYLEIGVETGRTLALVQQPSRALGVDPQPKIQFSFSAETDVFPLTSDAFFEGHDISTEYGHIDMAFLDGLHQFEQTLRDFINTERHSRADTLVLIHDCLPLNRLTAQRERTSDFWTGDPWKIIPCLKKLRPDLEVFVIASAPTGLGVVTNLDPGSRVLGENWDDVIAEFVPLELEEDAQRRAKQLDIVHNDWETIRARIEAHRDPVAGSA